MLAGNGWEVYVVMCCLRASQTAGRPVCAWLGVFAIVLHTLLSPVLAHDMRVAAGASETVIICTHDGSLTAVIPADQDDSGQNRSGQQSDHNFCAVCTFLHAAKILIAPKTAALLVPLALPHRLQFPDELGAYRALTTSSYASRAPPQIA